MEKKFKLQLPKMPNFIRLDMGTVGKRQDGFQEMPTIAVSDLSKVEAEEYAEAMRTEFLKHWKKKSNPLP